MYRISTFSCIAMLFLLNLDNYVTAAFPWVLGKQFLLRRETVFMDYLCISIDFML